MTDALKHGKLQNIQVGLVYIETTDALRAVETETDSFKGLVSSIKAQGLLNPISVRPMPDGRFAVIEGAHRTTAMKLLGAEVIPCNILEKDDVDTLRSQLIGNFVRQDTRKVDAAKALLRLMKRDNLMTVSSLADQISMSPQWVQQQLDLTKLDESVQERVNNGSISLTLAYAIGKLPVEEQAKYADIAIAVPLDEAIGQIGERVKAIKLARSQGRAAAPAEFVPKAHLLSISEILEAIEKNTLPGLLPSDCDTPEKMLKFALQWVVQMTKPQIAVKRAAWQERKVKAEADKAAAKAEREKKAAEAAAKKPTVADILNV